MTICAHPSCDAKLSRVNRTGVCIAHIHAIGICKCRQCDRKDGARSGRKPVKNVMDGIGVELRRYAEQGWTVAEVARAMGKSRKSVADLARRRGVEFRRGARPPNPPKPSSWTDRPDMPKRPRQLGALVSGEPVSDETRRLIDAAVAAGRITRVPRGASAFAPGEAIGSRFTKEVQKRAQRNSALVRAKRTVTTERAG